MADETPEEPLETRHPLGQTHTDLKVPRSRMTRGAIALAWNEAAERVDLRILVFAAALGLCDEELGGFLVRAGIRYDGDLRIFGHRVGDYLTGLPEGKAATMAQIITAGDHAVALCQRAIRVEEAAVAARAGGFTARSSAASSSSSSTSSESSASGSAGWVPSTPPTPGG